MIIQKNESQILTMGSTKNTAVTFDENSVSKLMTILTTNLYSDPKSSIMREYFCNCVDAMLGVGNTKDPIIIQLDRNNLKFIDFGIGLDELEFENIFCKILKSTKGHSNDAIGSWGLGSKSAFSYTDSFTVQSTKNGVKRIWNLTKDAMNVINAAKVVETKAKKEDKSGTVVTVPIISYHYDDFRKAARIQLQYFKQVYYDFDLANDFNIYEYKDFIYNDKFYSNVMGISLGGVRYEIDFNVLNISTINVPIALKFNIGELDVTPSREGLFWTQRTINAVKDKIDKVRDWMQKEVKKGQKNHDDYIKYLSEDSSKTYIQLDGNTIDITSLVGANSLSKMLYTGSLQAKDLRDVFPESRYIQSGRIYKSNPGEYMFRHQINDIMFYKKYSRHKILYAINAGIVSNQRKFVKVDSDYLADVEKHIKKYGGWLDDIVVPKAVKSNYSSSTKDPKEKDEIVLGWGKIYNGNADGCAFAKENYKVSEVDNITSCTFIGTSSDRELLSNAVKLGFPAILTANSNLKYFSKNKNVKNVSKMLSSKDYKDLVTKYHQTKYVVEHLKDVITNYKSFDDNFDPALNTFLKEYVNNISDLNALDVCGTVKDLLEAAIVEFNLKIPASLEKKVGSYKHLQNAKWLSNSTSEYTNSLGLIELRSWRNEISKQEAVEFLLEYHKLYKKCGK